MQISLDTSKSDGTIGLPGGSDSKESACNTGDPDPIPGWRRSAGERSGNPVLPLLHYCQYSCLEIPVDRGEVWWAIIHGVTKSLT